MLDPHLSQLFRLLPVLARRRDYKLKLLIFSSRDRLSSYREFSDALRPLGVEAICVDALNYCSLSECRPFNIVPIPKLLRLIKEFNPDFVMTDSLFFNPNMVKLVSQRLILHLRNLWNECYWEKVMNPSIFIRMFSHYEEVRNRLIMEESDLILPNSKWLQAQVNEYLPDSFTQVLHVGIDPKQWVPNSTAPIEVKHPAVVGIFQLTVYPKVLGLLNFIKVVKKMPDVNFYFAGEGQYFNLIKQNCPPNMYLMGEVSSLGVKKLLVSSDIFVHPSGLDALPRIVKEASLMEKPIVASNVGGIPEIVRNNETGYLCEIDDVGEWTQKIRFLLDNPDVAQKFGISAHKFVEETFDWKLIAKHFLEILKDSDGDF